MIVFLRNYCHIIHHVDDARLSNRVYHCVYGPVATIKLTKRNRGGAGDRLGQRQRERGEEGEEEGDTRTYEI